MTEQRTATELRPSITTGQFKEVYDTVRNLATDIAPSPTVKSEMDERCRRAALGICKDLHLGISLADLDPDGKHCSGKH
jgi:hypothetical protein